MNEFTENTFEHLKEMILEKYETKKTFYEKIKFLGDIIKIYCTEPEEKKKPITWVKWLFEKILDTFKQYDYDLPLYLPRYFRIKSKKEETDIDKNIEYFISVVQTIDIGYSVEYVRKVLEIFQEVV